MPIKGKFCRHLLRLARIKTCSGPFVPQFWFIDPYCFLGCSAPSRFVCSHFVFCFFFVIFVIDCWKKVVRVKTSLFMDKWPQPIFGIGCSTFLIVCSRRGGSSATANDWEERNWKKKPKRRGPAVLFVHSGVKRDHESDRPKDSPASVQLCTRNLRPGGLSRIRRQLSVTDS